jgi:hypothetical protein
MTLLPQQSHCIFMHQALVHTTAKATSQHVYVPRLGAYNFHGFVAKAKF